ncbi:bromodomain-containing protein DDB_G0270170-like [Daktulosphaira vitifoliae]|uniref:bromodomain-containing protein DDB_G0270170-like n=1 Tax=Daktulosphaira vitifoliae TaxID=58002 RepID=UPI0021AA1D85|nr:bromodomain-containing protein DDB_G0270170-like [Daktulosphaira vitifoliae]
MSRYSSSLSSNSSSSSCSDDSSDESSSSTGSSSSSRCSSSLSSVSSSSSNSSSSSSSSDDSSNESSSYYGRCTKKINLKRKYNDYLDEPNKKMCCELPCAVGDDWSFKGYPWLLDPERETNFKWSNNKSMIDLPVENKITVTRGTDVGIKMEKDFLAGDFATNVEPIISNSIECQHANSHNSEEDNSYSENVDLTSTSQHNVSKPEYNTFLKNVVKNNTNDLDEESVMNEDIHVDPKNIQLDMNVDINNNCSEPSTSNNEKYSNTSRCVKCKIFTPWGEDWFYTTHTDMYTGPRYITLMNPLNEFPVSYVETIDLIDSDDDEQPFMNGSTARGTEVQPMNALAHTNFHDNNCDGGQPFIVDHYEKIAISTTEGISFVYDWIPEMREVIFKNDSI